MKRDSLFPHGRILGVFFFFSYVALLVNTSSYLKSVESVGWLVPF